MEPQGYVEAHKIEKLFLKAPLVENGNKERDTSADSIFKFQKPSSSASMQFVPDQSNE
jgi:hypothetical protein